MATVATVMELVMKRKSHRRDVADAQILMTVDRVAERWSCGRATVVRLMTRAGVRPIFLGVLRRYRAADVLAVENADQS